MSFRLTGIIKRMNPAWFLFTRQEAEAMLLRSAYLPGQRHQLAEDERKAFGRGVLAALNLLMPSEDK